MFRFRRFRHPLIRAAAAAAAAVTLCGCFTRIPVPAVRAEASSSATRAVVNLRSGSGNSGGGATAGRSDIHYYFPKSGGHAKDALLRVINSAKKTLDIAVYSFTDQDFASAIARAKRRGVKVRIITDSECSGDYSQKEVLSSLKSAGIPIKINSYDGLMHLKMTVADRKTVTTGSFNYTIAAERYNEDIFVVIRNSSMAAACDKKFSSMWNDAGNYKTY